MQIEAQQPKIFQDDLVPTGTRLAGLSALTHAFQVAAPIRHPSAVSEQHVKGHVRRQGSWTVYGKRYSPDDTVAGHLDFAMRYEIVDLLVLKRVFQAIPANSVAEYIQAAPTGIFTRRAWYLFETLTGKTLDIPDAPKVAATDVLDPTKYFTRAEGSISRRHKVRDNLLGTAQFCPIIRRTDTLQAFVDRDLARAARQAIGRVSGALIARAASFLLLADSQASFQIEGERPPRSRLERWGRAVMQAGKYALSTEELIRLHGILIEDNRFVEAGLRRDGVFLGEHTVDGEPLPEFIGARPEDLPQLMEGLCHADAIMKEGAVDPIIQATATAFGFVYIHPFADGNGRLQRCLIHHVLSERQFSPQGVVFPVSSAMLEWIDEYRRTLQAHSGRLMPYIEWQPTAKGNVEVTNDTADLYRYFDCTEAAEFLYRCVERTIAVDLPREIDYLTRRDEALRQLAEVVEMPNIKAEQFVLYVHRNNGSLPKKRRSEFSALKDDEISSMENIVRVAFEGFDSSYAAHGQEA